MLALEVMTGVGESPVWAVKVARRSSNRQVVGGGTMVGSKIKNHPSHHEIVSSNSFGKSHTQRLVKRKSCSYRAAQPFYALGATGLSSF